MGRTSRWEGVGMQWIRFWKAEPGAGAAHAYCSRRAQLTQGSAHAGLSSPWPVESLCLINAETHSPTDRFLCEGITLTKAERQSVHANWANNRIEKLFEGLHSGQLRFACVRRDGNSEQREAVVDTSEQLKGEPKGGKQIIVTFFLIPATKEPKWFAVSLFLFPRC